MKEFELEIRLRNNLLRRRRIELGLSSAELSRRTGVDLNTISKYENLKGLPIKSPNAKRWRKHPTWKDSAMKLAEFFGCSPEELWPETILAVKQSSSVVEIAAEQTLALAKMSVPLELSPAPDELLEMAQLPAELAAAMDCLSPRERELLGARFGLDDGEEKTLEGAAESIGLHRSKERIRQIQDRSLRKIRKHLGITVQDD